MAWAEGRHWSFPINLRTFEQLLGRDSTSEEMEATLAAWRIPFTPPRSSEEYVLSRVGRRFFDLFYRGYTRKQWGREAADLDPAVAGRIPVRYTRDDRYLDLDFQALPADGYTRLFERILDHPSLDVRLDTDFAAVRSSPGWRHLVWTGPVDAYFDCRLGPLPWRALRWEREPLDVEFAQPAVQVNYPDEHDWTRILEFKHITGQRIPHTTLVREYPGEPGPGWELAYALPAAGARALHEPYARLAAAERDVTFLGRFGTHRNLDMDQAVDRAIEAAARIGSRLSRPGVLSRRRTPCEAPARVEVELVVARFREDVDWVRKAPSSVRVTILDKGGDLDPARIPWARVESLPNAGREAQSYLHHLASRYDSLAPITVFCQGHPFDHARDFHEDVRRIVEGREIVDGFRWLGHAEDMDDPRGRRLFVPWSRNADRRELALDRFHDALFGTPCPDLVSFRLGAQFAVTAECARRRSREFYERAMALSAAFPDAAHCFERLWDRVFVTGR
jgi:UDP-galactopyranose mutase